jgi:hypothetical protein
MRFARAVGCLLSIFVASMAIAADDPADYELHDISLWLSDMGQTSLNTFDLYASALPATASSKRRLTSQGAALRPWGMITLWGKPVDKFDLELRVKKGEFLAHWPPGEVKGNRLQWSNYEVLESDRMPDSPLEPTSLFRMPRAWDVLSVVSGQRRERFLAYDCQLEGASPVKITGGSEHYSVENLTFGPLSDVVVFIPNRKGGQIAYVEEVGGKPTTVNPKPETPPKADAKDNKAATTSAPVELALEPASKPAIAAIRKKLVEHWRALGLTADETKLLDDHLSQIFKGDDMLVLCRMPPAWSEDRLRLMVFPEPKKTVRVALVAVLNASPAILEEAQRLTAQLGSRNYPEREKAEQSLVNLGQLALPAVKKALESTDPEIAYRAERIQQTISDR